MDNNQLNTRIIDFLERSPSPMTAESVASDLCEPRYRVDTALNELEVGKVVVEIIPENKNSARKYYTLRKKLLKEVNEKNISNDEEAVNVVKSVITQETVNVKDGYKDLSEKIDRIDKNVNGLYANMISIMSIFVAIFALITVNANIVFKLTREDMQAVFWGIIGINAFVVFCIVALLIGVRIIIINPLLGKSGKIRH